MIEKALQAINHSYLLYYFLVVSFSGIMLTIYDKTASKYRSESRVPERSLFMNGLFGAALAMYITMKLIRHKTKHKSFMIAFPIMIIFHLTLIILIVFPRILG